MRKFNKSIRIMLLERGTNPSFLLVNVLKASASQTTDYFMIKKFLKSLSVVLLLALLSEPLIALAEYIDPSKVELETEAYVPEFFPSERGKYNYKVAWQGIPVARASIDVNNALLGENEFLSVTAWAKTSGPVGLLYRLDHTSQSLINADTYEPLMFRSDELINRRKKGRFVSFGEDGKIYSRRWKEGRKPQINEFFTKNTTLDPISAAVIARSLPIEEGRHFAFDVYNGKHRYEISFEIKEKEEIRVGKEKRLAFKVVPSVKKLTDSRGERKLKSATLWISADDKREILKLESKVWVGSVTATMTGFSPDHKVARLSQSQLALK